MNVIPTPLPGVLLIEPKVFGDPRGYFLETWNQRAYSEAGISTLFVQDNLSYSTKGILRGLHIQAPTSQAKLVAVLSGEVFDVAVDVRLGSPTFGKHYGVTLSAENHRQLFIPEGFAHGFAVTGEHAIFCYKCSRFYAPQEEFTIRWDDPDLQIPWTVADPIVSKKDGEGLRLKDVAPDRLPRYQIT